MATRANPHSLTLAPAHSGPREAADPALREAGVRAVAQGQGYRPYAAGGWITEPVIGAGLRSGATYTIAERGPEYVVPMRRATAAQEADDSIKVEVHFHGNVVSREIPQLIREGVSQALRDRDSRAVTRGRW